MPAAAVIPAPIAYAKVAAVKKLVVGSQLQAGRASKRCGVPRWTSCLLSLGPLHWVPRGGRCIYFEKIRVLNAGALPE